MAAICVFCASSRSLEQRWLDLARQTGEELGRRGHTLVSGGGRVGMMGVVGRARHPVLDLLIVVDGRPVPPARTPSG